MSPADTRPTDLRRRNVILMIALTIVTLGMYYPIWFLRRRAALNRLDAPRKLQAWPFVLFIAYIVVHLIVALGSDPAAEPRRGDAVEFLLDGVRLAFALLMVVQCFFVKDILEDHLSGPGESVSSSMLSDSVKPSALLTLFFGIFYLQHVINRHVVDAHA